MEKSFFNKELALNAKGCKLSKSEIEQVISFAFKGKEDFIELYTIHNGISFPNGAFFYRDSLYKVSEDDYNLLSVEAFFSITTPNGIIDVWNATKENNRIRKFAQTHIPFAVDASGNFFWIEIPSGQIKYVPMETPNEETLVAPSFGYFYKNLQPTMR